MPAVVDDGTLSSRGRPHPLPSVRRALSVRRPSAGARFRIPSAQLGRQLEFITCTVGDTTHSRGHNWLAYLYKLILPGTAAPDGLNRGRQGARQFQRKGS